MDRKLANQERFLNTTELFLESRGKINGLLLKIGPRTNFSPKVLKIEPSLGKVEILELASVVNFTSRLGELDTTGGIALVEIIGT